MKFNETQHIAKQQLELLVEEQLDSNQESQLISHIDQCEDCQTRLERLVENGNEWSSIHQHLIEGDELETSDESSIRKFLALLGPTDNPEMLGRLERYEVTAVIGSGSTGIVAKAFERTLNRFVAIKVLHPKLCDSGAARKRFDREGRAIAAVVNPHVVPVFAIGEHVGHPFIVMQYMPGGSLQQRIARDGQLSAEAVARLGLHIAEGLEAAHAQGIVHRDVKPANVMLESGSDRAMVSDFGLARVTNEASMTCSGLITGTPQYMSPEQARGEALDGRSDLFSLGSTLYAACTGHPPFRAENAFGVIKRVCDEQPRSILESNPQTPIWLVAFIEVLMSKKKEDRISSAAKVTQHLSAELAHMQAPQAVSQPSRPWHRPSTKNKRKTFALWCTAAIGLALVGSWMVVNPVATMFQGSFAGVGTYQEDQAEQHEELMQAITHLVRDEGRPLKTFSFVKKHSDPVQENGNLVIRSDLAEITVETHDKPRVDIEVVISIAATNRKQAEALFGKHEFRKRVRGDDFRGKRLIDGRDALFVSGWRSVECDPGQFTAETIEQFLTQNNQPAEQYIDQAKNQLVSSGRRESIDTQLMQELSIRRILESNEQCQIRLRVKVPKQFNLNIFTATGRVSLPDISGNVNVVVNDANVTLGNTVGDLDVFVEDGFLLAGDVTGNAVLYGKDCDTKLGDVSGDVEVCAQKAHVEVNKVDGLAYVQLDDGRIQIGTANGGARMKIAKVGDIHIGDVTGEIQASTGEGTITVERMGQINANSTVSTKDGTIRIGIESDTSVDIEARSEKGNVRGSLVPAGKTNVADIELDGGGPTLLLRSQRSSIQLDEADKKTIGTQEIDAAASQ